MDLLHSFKQISDEWIEEWLLLEEKMCQMRQWIIDQDRKNERYEQAMRSESFQKGEGYYKLWMYRKANEYFMQVIKQYPDFMLARVYLALTYMEINQFDEAMYHLNRIVPLTDDVKLKAIAYHAMGCIEVYKNHMDKAVEYFKKARKTDPTLSYYSLS